MQETTRHISPRQYALLELAGFLGIGIFEFPRALVSTSGNNAWWGFLLSWGVAYVGVWLLLKVAYVDPRETLFGMARRIMPDYVYWGFGVVDTALHILLPIISLGQFGFVIVTFFLPETPIWMVELTLMGIACLVAWWELPALARSTEMLFVPTMMISITLLALLVPHVADAYAMLPSLNVRLMPVAYGGLRTFYIFIGFEVIPILWPYIRRQDQPQARRYTYYAVTGAGIFYAIVMAVTVGVENPWYLRHLEWPGVSALRLIDVQGLIINKLGLLIVVFWGVVSLIFISVRLWAITHVILPMIHRRTIHWYRGMVLGLAVLIFLLVRTVPNIAVIDRLTRFMVPLMVGFVLGYPPLFILAAVTIQSRRRRRRGPAPPARRLSAKQRRERLGFD